VGVASSRHHRGKMPLPQGKKINKDKEKLLKGTTINGRTYKNYIDGYNQLDYLTGKAKESPRKEFWYVNDDGQIVAARYDAWKVVFLENRGDAFGVWR
jgi:arylsulfatase